MERELEYSRFEVDVLERLSSIEQDVKAITLGFRDLNDFAKVTAKELLSMKIECSHHREKTKELETKIREARSSIEERVKATAEIVDEHQRILDQVSGGKRATLAIVAVITTIANAIWLVIQHFLPHTKG